MTTLEIEAAADAALLREEAEQDIVAAEIADSEGVGGFPVSYDPETADRLGAFEDPALETQVALGEVDPWGDDE